MSDMENKAIATLQLVAKRLGIPEDKIEDMSKSNDDICRARMQDGKYLIYSWYVPEESFAVVNITNNGTDVGCSLGSYIETEASLDRIISAIKEFRDTPEESVVYMTGRVFSALFREGMVSDIPKSSEEGVGHILLVLSRVVSAKGNNIPVNSYIVVTLRKQDSLTYQISYSDLSSCLNSELIEAEDHERLCDAIVSKIRDVYQTSKHELGFMMHKEGQMQSWLRQ